MESLDSMPQTISDMHAMTSDALESFRKSVDMDPFVMGLCKLIRFVMKLANYLECNIWTEIDKKLEKNMTRGFRHGNRKV